MTPLLVIRSIWSTLMGSCRAAINADVVAAVAGEPDPASLALDALGVVTGGVVNTFRRVPGAVDTVIDATGALKDELFAVSAVLAFAGAMRATFVALGLGAAVVAFAIRSLSMRRTHLEVRDGVLTFKGLIRDRVLNDPGTPGRVVEVTLSGVAQADGQIWIGSLDQVMLMTAAWDDNALTDLAHRLGWEIFREPDRPSLQELAKRYPGVVPWYAAHPYLAGAVVLAVSLAVLVPFTV